MDTFLQQLFNLFVAPPGSLIYYLVLAFAITGAFQAVMIGRPAGSKPSKARLYVGLGLLLAGQVSLFAASGLAWQGFVDPHVVLPPLDRAVTALGLVWIAWLWLFPSSNRLADAIAGLLSLVVIIAFGFTLNSWAVYPPGTSFNTTVFDRAWELSTLVIVLAGMLLLFVRRPEGWGTGLGMLTFNLAGHLVHFLWPEVGGDFSGVIRLAQLCSFPLLPVLAHRGRPAPAIAETVVAPVVKDYRPAAPGVQFERRHYSADPRTVYDWLQIAVSTEPGRTYVEFTRAFAQTMLADVCLLLRAPDASGTVTVAAGFDLIHEEFLHIAPLNRESIPAVANALQKGRALRLGGADGNSSDLDVLAEALSLEKPGYIMLVPLANPPFMWGGFLLLSPYSNRPWSADDQTYLLSSIETMVSVLQQGKTSTAAVAVPDDYGLIKDELNLAHRQIDEMKGDNRILLEEIAVLRSSMSPNTDLDGLLAVQKETQEIITSLQQENERLQAALAAGRGLGSESAYLAETAVVEGAAGKSLQHLEVELRKALEQVAHLQNALAESNMQLLALQKIDNQAAKGKPVEEDGAVIAALVQELRQPMASITGYTDLLLAESAGIIGALQRNFLDRIKGSIERMQAIINDLVQMTNLQSGPVELTPESINASVLIDEAVAAINSQLRSKNITLRVDMPDELPEIQADRDALQQIVVHLLQNASSVTPGEGTISLKLRVQQDDRGQPAMLFQVTDSGGGISNEDLPRVFSRRYRADNPLIQGVGDTGVGLSIARTLVEAHQGRIWVESIQGQSSTFSVLLPLNPRSEPTAGAS